ncbi:MAG: hypothetical protein ACU0BF_06990 [Paracoccaceae bacterium]
MTDLAMFAVPATVALIGLIVLARFPKMNDRPVPVRVRRDVR